MKHFVRWGLLALAAITLMLVVANVLNNHIVRKAEISVTICES
jgi:hypothetical protein